jgi:hypothetical protein
MVVSQDTTYTVFRHRRSATENSNTVVACGLSLSKAESLAKRLQKAKAAAKPYESSWTRDVLWFTPEK